ncbi:hypothetical protein OIO90_001155 [Microbotryomycetes sp. JL221]|nr:hypothetical protein OIO90_001155 [Microbotryomycetes sp. JL221]
MLVVDTYAATRALTILQSSRVVGFGLTFISAIVLTCSFVLHALLVSGQAFGIDVARVISHIILDVVLVATLLRREQSALSKPDEKASKFSIYWMADSKQPPFPFRLAATSSKRLVIGHIASILAFIVAGGSFASANRDADCVIGVQLSTTFALIVSVLVFCRLSVLVIDVVLPYRIQNLSKVPFSTTPRRETAMLLHNEGNRPAQGFTRTAPPSSAILLINDEPYHDIPDHIHSITPDRPSTYHPHTPTSPQGVAAQDSVTKPERPVLRSPPSSSSLHSSAFWIDHSSPPSCARSPSIMDVFSASPTPQPSSSATKRRSSLSVLQTFMSSPKRPSSSAGLASPQDLTSSPVEGGIYVNDDPFARSPSRQAIDSWRKRSGSVNSLATSGEFHGGTSVNVSRVPTIFEVPGAVTATIQEQEAGADSELPNQGDVFASGLGLTWSPEDDAAHRTTEILTARHVSRSTNDDLTLTTVATSGSARELAPFSSSPTPPVHSIPPHSVPSSPRLVRSPSSMSLWRKNLNESARRTSSPRQRLIASLRGLAVGGNNNNSTLRKNIFNPMESGSQSDLSFACVGDNSPRPSFAKSTTNIAPRRSLSDSAIQTSNVDQELTVTYPPFAVPFNLNASERSQTAPSTPRASVRQTLSSTTKKSWWKLGASTLRPTSRVGTPYKPRSMSAPAIYSSSSSSSSTIEGSTNSSNSRHGTDTSYDFVSAIEVRRSLSNYRLPTPRRLSPLSSALFERHRASLESRARIHDEDRLSGFSSSESSNSFVQIDGPEADARRRGSMTSLEQLTVVADAMHRFSEEADTKAVERDDSEQIGDKGQTESNTLEIVPNIRLREPRSLSALVSSPRSLLSFDEMALTTRPPSAHFFPLSPQLYARSQGWSDDSTHSTIESLDLDSTIASHHQTVGSESSISPSTLTSPTMSITSSEAMSPPVSFVFSPNSQLFQSPLVMSSPPRSFMIDESNKPCETMVDSPATMTPPTPMSSFIEFGLLHDKSEHCYREQDQGDADTGDEEDLTLKVDQRCSG